MMKMQLKLSLLFLSVTILLTTTANSEKHEKKFNLKKFLKHVLRTAREKSYRNPNAGSLQNDDTCSDYGSWCPKYKSYCSVKTVKDFCKNTCNSCIVPTSPPVTDCKDSYEHCKVAARNGYCTSNLPRHLNFMQNNCRKTCNLCKPKQCSAVDKRSDCHKLKDYCNKVGYVNYMKTNCLKTCGYCKEEVKCGVAKRRSIVTNKGIQGGVEAKKGYYPWQVAIYYEEEFLCGGSLIGTRHVLTAAHCFRYHSKDMSLYQIVLGDHDRSVKEGTEEVIEVKSIQQNEKYNHTRDTHDIAIIELKKDVTTTIDINPICLPSANEELPAGTECYLTGWGKNHIGGEVVNRLFEVAMPIAKLEHCKERNTFDHHVVNSNMICAGYDNGNDFKSGCHGDSGGPLACIKPDNTWALHGVVSWGSPQCNGLDRYTVFTKVSKYIDWIKKNQSS